MSLMRYLRYLAGQLIGFTVGTRRPGLLILIVLGALALLLGLLVQTVAPVAIYPFL